MRALAIAHVALAILLIPVSLFPLTLAPILLIGPVWAMLLARRMWRFDPTVLRALRRTHAVFLLIDALLISYGFWMLRAAERSAARGGGLLGGIGVIPIGLGLFLGCFSIVTLAFARRNKKLLAAL